MDSKMIDFALWKIGEANPLLSLHEGCDKMKIYSSISKKAMKVVTKWKFTPVSLRKP